MEKGEYLYLVKKTKKLYIKSWFYSKPSTKIKTKKQYLINIKYLIERREFFITFKQLKTIKHPTHSATTQISLLVTSVRN